MLGGLSPLGAQFAAPGEAWQTFDTPHFRVYYTAELEPLARKAGRYGEDAYARLSESFVAPPPGKVELVITDQHDVVSGAALSIFNRIVIGAHPPVDEPELVFFDDWMQLVVLHELVHVFHMNNVGGVAKPLRAAFGRLPFAFPQVWSSPDWVTEGMATYYESKLTHGGRVRGTHFDMLLRSAVLEDDFFSLDRVTGGSSPWPYGTPYLYGSSFIAEMAERHGPERIRAFVEQVGKQLIPYRLDAAARKTLGTPLARAWADWQRTLGTRYHALADSLRAQGLTEPEILTREGGEAAFPRFAPAGDRIAYYASTGRSEPETRIIDAAGATVQAVRRKSGGPAAWIPGGAGLLLSQLESPDQYRLRADLYRMQPDGRELRLTTGARVMEPDVHPDGRRAIAVRTAAGTNTLVLVDLATGEVRPLVESSPDVHWSLPRWAPTGDRIAVGRWRTGGRFDVVVLDSTGAVIRELTGDRAVDRAPAWSPDGRHVVFSSDRSGISNLYAYDLREGRLHQVTNVLTGAFEPDVSPDGRWIVFSLYRADGYHVARIPFDPSAWRAASPVRSAVAEPVRMAAPAPVPDAPSRPYSALASLRPLAWMLLPAWSEGLGWGGAGYVYGTDVIGRHEYQSSAVVYQGGNVDLELEYSYLGWSNPRLDVHLFQEWSGESVAAGGSDAGSDSPAAMRLRRERWGAASLTFLRPRMQSFGWLSVGVDAGNTQFAWAAREGSEPAASLPDAPLEVGAGVWGGYSTVRGYRFSVSPEDGFRVSGAAQLRRRLGSPAPGTESGGWVRLSGTGQGFHGFEVAGFARHVLGLRLSSAAELGGDGPGLRLGGTGGSDLAAGEGGTSLHLRGYPGGAQAGDRAVSATAEYRFPLALVRRGMGTRPVFLDRTWGDVFLDAGSAWCAGACDRLPGASTSPRPLGAVGTELGMDLRYGYYFDLTLRGGVALPLTLPAAGGQRVPQLYLTAGRSF